jgi:hypothetical protein
MIHVDSTSIAVNSVPAVSARARSRAAYRRARALGITVKCGKGRSQGIWFVGRYDCVWSIDELEQYLDRIEERLPTAIAAE